MELLLAVEDALLDTDGPFENNSEAREPVGEEFALAGERDLRRCDHLLVADEVRDRVAKLHAVEGAEKLTRFDLVSEVF